MGSGGGSNGSSGGGSSSISVGLRPFVCCDHGFESHPGHGCLSGVSVVYCQVEVSATN
jgi:hypothetical protein